MKPNFRSASGVFCIAVLVLSALASPLVGLAGFLAFRPVLDVPTLWTPLTYTFVATDPFGIIISIFMLLTMGGQLERTWGTRRYVLFSLGITIGAALLTLALAFVWPRLTLHVYPGATILIGALWVATGLNVGNGPSNFFGLPITGFQFAWLGVAFTVLTALFAGVEAIVPSAFALLLTYLSYRGFGPGRLVHRFRTWQLERMLRRRGMAVHEQATQKRSPPNHYLN